MNNDNVINLVDMFQLLWIKRSIAATITGICLLIAILVALLSPDVYRSEALLIPNTNNQPDAILGQSASLLGLGALSGLRLPSPPVDKTAYGIELLQARRFLTNFLAEHNLVSEFSGTTSTSKSSDESQGSEGTAGEPREPVQTVFTSQVSDAYDQFTEQLHISRDKNTGFVRIRFDDESATLAKKIVDELVVTVNTETLNQDVREARNAIDYLEERLNATAQADMRQVLVELIKEQTKIVMLAKMSDEYLFKTVDPAVVATKPSGPYRALIIVLGLLFGLLISFLFVAFAQLRPSN